MIYHIYFDKGNRSTTLYIFKNEKEVVCLHEKNCQSNSSNSDEDLSIYMIYMHYYICMRIKL